MPKQTRCPKPNANGTLWELSDRLEEPRPGYVRDVWGYYATEQKAQRAGRSDGLKDWQTREVLA